MFMITTSLIIQLIVAIFETLNQTQDAMDSLKILFEQLQSQTPRRDVWLLLFPMTQIIQITLWYKHKHGAEMSSLKSTLNSSSQLLVHRILCCFFIKYHLEKNDYMSREITPEQMCVTEGFTIKNHPNLKFICLRKSWY